MIQERVECRDPRSRSPELFDQRDGATEGDLAHPFSVRDAKDKDLDVTQAPKVLAEPLDHMADLPVIHLASSSDEVQVRRAIEKEVRIHRDAMPAYTDPGLVEVGV